jgi:hypothetical protein
MTMWFRVDDDFYEHPKWVGVSDSAVSLWLRSGAWCAHYLTDGCIPIDVMMTLGMSGRYPGVAAEELASRGLWVPGDDAWMFHDWQDYQPTRAGVMVRRAADAERRRRYLARVNGKGHAVTARVSNASGHAVTARVTDAVTEAPGHAVTDAVTARVSHDVPGPSRRDGAVVQVSNPPSDRNAREAETGGERNPDEDVNDLVIAAMRQKTGRTITRAQADALRVAQLGARDDIRHPGMYLHRMIMSDADPARLIPAPARRRVKDTGPPPVGEVLAKANDPEGRGRKPRASDESRAAIAAQAREALAAKEQARRDAAARDADAEQPDPEPPEDYAVQPGDDDPEYPPDPPGQDHDTELF